VIERDNQQQKEFLAATKQVWVKELANAIHFSNLEDAQRYKDNYQEGNPHCRIGEYPWPQLRARG
jgi:hypothetical protein